MLLRGASSSGSAPEKEDEEEAAALEHLDPCIVDRLRTAGHEIDAIPGEDQRDRRERFGRISDECYARHARGVVGRR